MKLKFIIPIALTLSLTVFGCSHKSDEAKNEHDHSHHVENNATTSLTLNNGKRWNMDDHTRSMISKMETTFLGANHTNKDSLNEAGTTLTKQVDTLIAGCTMEGKSHDQLHIFLTDYIPTVHNLAKDKDLNSARSTAILLKEQLKIYRQHFK